MMWHIIALAGCLGVGLFGDPMAGVGPTTVTCQGTVVDDAGQPIANVLVTAYRRVRDSHTYQYRSERLERGRTARNGALLFQFTADGSGGVGTIVAWKEGRAIAWDCWSVLRPRYIFSLVLGQPKPLAGVVVDDNGAPIADAEVRASFTIVERRLPRSIVGRPGFGRLVTRTNRAGRFSFDFLPARSRARLVVSSPGRATVLAGDAASGTPPAGGFAAGKTDVRIVLPPEARIEGVVVDHSSGRPLPEIWLRLDAHPGWAYATQGCVSADDGRSSFSGLAAGWYTLTVPPPPTGQKNWVAPPLRLDVVESGQVDRSVKMALSRPGFVEVIVTNGTDNRPLEGIEVQCDAARLVGESGIIRTNERGVARLRLLAGSYVLPHVRGRDYLSASVEAPIQVVEGATLVRHLELRTPAETCRLVVIDQIGKPVSNAQVWIHGLRTSEQVATDENGVVELSIDTFRLDEDQLEQVIVVRHVGRNLARAVDAERTSESLEVMVKPGATLVGRVTDPTGKPIPNADVRIVLQHDNLWQRFGVGATTDAQGRYEVNAVPIDRGYLVRAQAAGFGVAYRGLKVGEHDAARIEVAQLALSPATATISGVVIDVNGKPLPGAVVSATAHFQPMRSTVADDAGRFVIRDVMATEMTIEAGDGNHLSGSWGEVDAQGGDTGVTVVVKKRAFPPSPPPAPRRSLGGQPLPSLDGFKLGPAVHSAVGKPILICVWNMSGVRSRQTMRLLGARTAELARQGVMVVSIHAAPVAQRRLQRWMSKHQLTIPVGFVPDDERISQLWGLQRVPMLILADADHVVRALGFSVHDLDRFLPRVIDK